MIKAWKGCYWDDWQVVQFIVSYLFLEHFNWNIISFTNILFVYIRKESVRHKLYQKSEKLIIKLKLWKWQTKNVHFIATIILGSTLWFITFMKSGTIVIYCILGKLIILMKSLHRIYYRFNFVLNLSAHVSLMQLIIIFIFWIQYPIAI